MIVGLIASTFDLLHAGHVHFIRNAVENCDRLVCALQTAVTDRDGKNPPVQSVYERYTQLTAIRGVETIIPYESEKDLYNLLLTTRHHIRFLGEDYVDKTVTGSNLYKTFVRNVHELKDPNLIIDFPCIVLLERRHDYSTTSLRQRIVNASK